MTTLLMVPKMSKSAYKFDGVRELRNSRFVVPPFAAGMVAGEALMGVATGALVTAGISLPLL